jgi:hypothetical protein
VKAARTEHVIWSTLEDSRDFIPLNDSRMPTTSLRTSFYWDNLIYFGMGPKRGADGTLAFLLPVGNRKLPGIAAADVGACAYGVFKRGKAFIGKTIGIAGEHLTGVQMAAALSRELHPGLMDFTHWLAVNSGRIAR